MTATLLIDNHDSFTYNLAVLIEAATGARPLIVRNDATDWQTLSQCHFDRIVISPGPGRPQRPADLGFSADAILHAAVPVLGVCLGHQAIAHLYGGEVGLAAQPVHGRLAQVRHGGEGLFRDLPSPFTAVRYHSLAVLGLSSDLEALAWAEDGTIMALRHRSRPLWGVQFHPESICAEHGLDLVRRFIELSPARTSKRGRKPQAIAAKAGRPDGKPPRWRVYARCLSEYVAPQQAFDALYARAEHAFWLDSSSAPAGNAAVSYMGDASGPNSEVLRYVLRDKAVSIVRGATVTTVHTDILSYLQSHLAQMQADTSAVPFDFTTGYVGYLGYEIKDLLFGADGHRAASTPDAWWVFADRVVAFDHLQQQTWLLCFDAWQGLCAANTQWLEEVERRLRATPVPSQGATEPPQQISDFEWRHDASAYGALIERSLQAIRDGETYEVCLTNQLTAQCDLAPLRTYQALRQANPAPYGALLRCGSLSVLCSSPELFLHIAASGRVESKPIKGTAARVANPETDAQSAVELANNPKSRSENLMIVDLIRNDLNRVCVAGSVHVPELFATESYRFVHQLVSTVVGTLRSGTTALDVIRATFPGGSMTGAPKERTMQLLEQLEQGPRGIYSGSLGYLSVSGAAMLNIVIRTMVVNGAQLLIGTGGAIVALSDPAAEIAETLLKMTGVTSGLIQAGVLAGNLTFDLQRAASMG